MFAFLLQDDMCTYIYIYVHNHIYIYIYIYLFTYTDTYNYIYIYILSTVYIWVLLPTLSAWSSQMNGLDMGLANIVKGSC